MRKHKIVTETLPASAVPGPQPEDLLLLAEFCAEAHLRVHQERGWARVGRSLEEEKELSCKWAPIWHLGVKNKKTTNRIL